MKTIPDKVCKIHHNHQKKGNIIFLHGFLSNPERYDKLSKKLNKLGYNTYQCTARGHGNRKESKKYEWKEYMDEINDIINDIDNDNIILIGHSMGATLTTSLTSINPKIKKAFIIEGIYDKDIWKNALNINKYKKYEPVFNNISSAFPENYNKCAINNKDRYYFIHHKNDNVVPFNQLEKNLQSLCMENDIKTNTLIFDWKEIPILTHKIPTYHKKTEQFIIDHLE